MIITLSNQQFFRWFAVVDYPIRRESPLFQPRRFSACSVGLI